MNPNDAQPTPPQAPHPPITNTDPSTPLVATPDPSGVSPTPVAPAAPVKKSTNWKLLSLIIASIVLIALIAYFALPMIFKKSSGTADGSATTPTSSTTSTSDTGSSATDDQSLQNDLNNAQTSQTQETTDQTSTDSALNDSSQQVTVPTN